MKILNILIISCHFFILNFSLLAGELYRSPDSYFIVEIEVFDETEKHGDDIFPRGTVYLSNGEVYDVDDPELIKQCQLLKDSQTAIYIKTYGQYSQTKNLEQGRLTLISIEIDSEKKAELSDESSQAEDKQTLRDPTKEKSLMNVALTTFNDFYSLENIFAGMRSRLRNRSQCFNRAHVWTYEAARKGTHLGKMWLFFSRKYIRQYKYKWWFHVAPYAILYQNSSPFEQADIILDKQFSRTPLSRREWTDNFMKNQAACLLVEQYSEYSLNQETQDCFLIKTSYYYWQPWQIANFEKNQVSREEWSLNELQKAYRNSGVGP